MDNFRERLLGITKDCRTDMHEPDIKAVVLGTSLDNALGEYISEEALVKGFQEIIVILDKNGAIERFNLATLIAYARIGAKSGIVI